VKKAAVSDSGYRFAGDTPATTAAFKNPDFAGDIGVRQTTTANRFADIEGWNR